MNILVVDPEAEIRLLFFIAADELHCEIFFAATGDEALDVWRSNETIGLVLVSTQLPDIDARELAARVRETHRGQHVAILFLSHSEDPDLLVELLKHGNDVVIKPFSQAVLMAKLLALQRTRKMYLQLDAHYRELEIFRSQTEAEVQVATDVFSYINAQNLPAIPGVSKFLSAYSSFSGDLLLMSPRPGEGFNVLIADITGHGLPAALGTIPMAETFFTMTNKGFGVGDIAREMNHVFRKRMPDYLLCAAILIAVQDLGRRLQIWSGGMPAQLIFDENGRVESFLHSRHMALGALTEREFDASVVSIDLRRGQQILCFTDGVTETTNACGEMFGEDNLLKAWRAAPPTRIVDNIVEALDTFTGNDKLSDDVTIFCFNNTEYDGVGEASATVADQHTIHDGFRWQTAIQMAASQLRCEHPLELIFTTLPSHSIVRAARADISFIINELFVNALDHGLLKMDSALKEQDDGLLDYFSQRETRLARLQDGYIEIKISCQIEQGIGSFNISCLDSGKGFDFTAAMHTDEDETRHSGRGLRTIAAMCDHIEANIQGNCIAVQYHWPRNLSLN